MPWLLALALVLVVTGSCTKNPSASAVALGELAAEQDAWDGRVVRAEGVLRRFDDPLRSPAGAHGSTW